MKTIEYKNLEWYIINETDKEKLLFLRDSFTNEQILKYFTDKSMLDDDCDVKYGKEINPWFIDSYIRKVLNSTFLSNLDKNDLNIMKTTLTLGNETSTTEDYVRLITKEEVEILQKTDMEVLKTSRKYGYWTMSPFYASSNSSALVFGVYGSTYPGHLSYNNVSFSHAVRPVISLKSEPLKFGISLEESDELREVILKFRKRTKG